MLRFSIEEADCACARVMSETSQAPIRLSSIYTDTDRLLISSQNRRPQSHISVDINFQTPSMQERSESHHPTREDRMARILPIVNGPTVATTSWPSGTRQLYDFRRDPIRNNGGTCVNGANNNGEGCGHSAASPTLLTHCRTSEISLNDGLCYRHEFPSFSSGDDATFMLGWPNGEWPLDLGTNYGQVSMQFPPSYPLSTTHGEPDPSPRNAGSPLIRRLDHPIQSLATTEVSPGSPSTHYIPSNINSTQLFTPVGHGLFINGEQRTMVGTYPTLSGHANGELSQPHRASEIHSRASSFNSQIFNPADVDLSWNQEHYPASAKYFGSASETMSANALPPASSSTGERICHRDQTLP